MIIPASLCISIYCNQLKAKTTQDTSTINRLDNVKRNIASVGIGVWDIFYIQTCDSYDKVYFLPIGNVNVSLSRYITEKFSIGVGGIYGRGDVQDYIIDTLLYIRERSKIGAFYVKGNYYFLAVKNKTKLYISGLIGYIHTSFEEHEGNISGHNFLPNWTIKKENDLLVGCDLGISLGHYFNIFGAFGIETGLFNYSLRNPRLKIGLGLNFNFD